MVCVAGNSVDLALYAQEFFFDITDMSKAQTWQRLLNKENAAVICKIFRGVFNNDAESQLKWSLDGTKNHDF